MPHIAPDWQEALAEEFDQPYYQNLRAFLKQEYATKTIYPPMEDIFNAFHACPLGQVKVLLLGQDPYHNAHQAHGLSFSVKPEQTKLPPSLVNIYKEMVSDLGCDIPTQGYLQSWAQQGVLMLNTVLTVQEHSPQSHQGQGWERFTDKVIHTLNQQERPIVYLLWGKPAIKKAAMLNNPQHLVLTAPHPSPLSAYRGFFGSQPFSKTNEFLQKHGLAPIQWQELNS